MADRILPLDNGGVLGSSNSWQKWAQTLTGTGQILLPKIRCKQPTTDEDIMCETCFAGVMRTTSANGEGSASPPEKGTEAVGGMDGTDVEGTQEEGLCDYHRYVQDGK